jgi:autophagy-related protein 2
VATEALSLGSRVATGTQLILEGADALLLPSETPTSSGDASSKYAHQPESTSAGLQQAYASLSRELRLARHTIVAIPLEQYEQHGATGGALSLIRAVPVAILKPIIGLTEGVSRTLLGARNSLAPERKAASDAKYK